MSLSTTIATLLKELNDTFVLKQKGKDLSEQNFTKAHKDKLDKLSAPPKDSYFLTKSEKDKIKSDTVKYIEVQGDSGVEKLSVGIYKTKPKTLPKNQLNIIL